MKKQLVAFALACAIPYLSFGQDMPKTTAQPNDASVTKELLKLVNWRANALFLHKIAAAAQLMADDYTYIDDEGIMWTKAQWVEKMKSGSLAYKSLVSDADARAYGDTAVVIGQDTIKGQKDDRDVSGQYRWTDTWVKLEGQWKIVASHSSKITQK